MNPGIVTWVGKALKIVFTAAPTTWPPEVQVADEESAAAGTGLTCIDSQALLEERWGQRCGPDVTVPSLAGGGVG